MNIDVSEIKDFRHCQRKWQLGSRNQFHLTAAVPPKAFALGTVFHNALHKLYLGRTVEEVKDFIMKSAISNDDKVMVYSMIRGYDLYVMPTDRERYEVLNIEHHFEIPVADMCAMLGLGMIGEQDDADPVILCGSIDMICLDKERQEIWGFEHKTAKNFRNEVYCWMDEQPRLYYAALMLYTIRYNSEHGTDYKLGGVFINEVRKLIRTSETKRTTLKYPDDDIRNFMYSLLTSVAECHKMVHDESAPRIPQPDYMACNTCMYNTICQTYQYSDIKLPDLLKEFNLEFVVRTTDHLEEKEEV